MANLGKELRKEIRNNNHEVSDSGLLIFPAQKLAVGGGFMHDVNGKDERFDPNLVVNEGLDYILGSAMDGTMAKVDPFYVSLFETNATPAATWIGGSGANNWSTIADEIDPAVDVSETTRPIWVESAVSSQQVDNYATKAAFNVIAALTVYGATLVTTSTFGDTAGKLIVASSFATSRVLQLGDVFNVGYRLSIAST